MTPATRKALEMAQEYFTEYSGYRSEDVAKAIAKALAEPACTACGGTKTVYGGEVCKFCDEPAPEPAMAFCPACFVEVSLDQCDAITRDAKLYREMLAAAPECKP